MSDNKFSRHRRGMRFRPKGGLGAVKDKQVQMDSEAFLNDNKVQLNRFQIPHQKLTGSAGNSIFAGDDGPSFRSAVAQSNPITCHGHSPDVADCYSKSQSLNFN